MHQPEETRDPEISTRKALSYSIWDLQMVYRMALQRKKDKEEQLGKLCVQPGLRPSAGPWGRALLQGCHMFCRQI